MIKVYSTLSLPWYVVPHKVGKHFVQKMLENNQKIIQPAPVRIIWCYGANQPAYEQMANTIKPTIEFYAGLPDDLYEQVQPSQNNLLIIDD